MIKRRTAIRPFELVLAFIILYTIMPLVAQFFSDFLTTYAFMAVLFGAVVFAMTLRGTDSLADSILLLLPFVMWMILEYLTKKQALILWGYSAMLTLAPLLFGTLLFKESGPKVIRFLTLILLGAVTVTTVTTIFGSIIYPDAARYLATVAESDNSKLQFYNRINLGGYDFVYVVVLLYPTVIFAFKQKKLRLVWAIVASVLVLFLTLNSGYTIAFLLWLATTITFFFPRKLKKRWVLIFLVIAIVLIVFFLSFFASGLKSLSKMVDNENISYRLEALSDGREGIQNSDDDRIYFYETSINTFLSSPFFGNIFRRVGWTGGHSFILDFLGDYGLVGAALLIVMYRVIYVRFYKPLERVTAGYGYIFWMFLQTVILSVINTGMWINVLAWLIPIMNLGILQAKTKEFKLQRDLKKAAEERRIRVK